MSIFVSIPKININKASHYIPTLTLQRLKRGGCIKNIQLFHLSGVNSLIHHCLTDTLWNKRQSLLLLIFSHKCIFIATNLIILSHFLSWVFFHFIFISLLFFTKKISYLEKSYTTSLSKHHSKVGTILMCTKYATPI